MSPRANCEVGWFTGTKAYTGGYQWKPVNWSLRENSFCQKKYVRTLKGFLSADSTRLYLACQTHARKTNILGISCTFWTSKCDKLSYRKHIEIAKLALYVPDALNIWTEMSDWWFITTQSLKRLSFHPLALHLESTCISFSILTAFGQHSFLHGHPSHGECVRDDDGWVIVRVGR